jgi:hypothetical protein
MSAGILCCEFLLKWAGDVNTLGTLIVIQDLEDDGRYKDDRFGIFIDNRGDQGT